MGTGGVWISGGRLRWRDDELAVAVTISLASLLVLVSALVTLTAGAQAHPPGERPVQEWLHESENADAVSDDGDWHYRIDADPASKNIYDVTSLLAAESDTDRDADPSLDPESLVVAPLGPEHPTMVPEDAQVGLYVDGDLGNSSVGSWMRVSWSGNDRRAVYLDTTANADPNTTGPKPGALEPAWYPVRNYDFSKGEAFWDWRCRDGFECGLAGESDRSSLEVDRVFSGASAGQLTDPRNPTASIQPRVENIVPPAERPSRTYTLSFALGYSFYGTEVDQLERPIGVTVEAPPPCPGIEVDGEDVCPYEGIGRHTVSLGPESGCKYARGGGPLASCPYLPPFSETFYQPTTSEDPKENSRVVWRLLVDGVRMDRGAIPVGEGVLVEQVDVTEALAQDGPAADQPNVTLEVVDQVGRMGDTLADLAPTEDAEYTLNLDLFSLRVDIDPPPRGRGPGDGVDVDAWPIDLEASSELPSSTEAPVIVPAREPTEIDWSTWEAAGTSDHQATLRGDDGRLVASGKGASCGSGAWPIERCGSFTTTTSGSPLVLEPGRYEVEVAGADAHRERSAQVPVEARAVHDLTAEIDAAATVQENSSLGFEVRVWNEPAFDGVRLDPQLGPVTVSVEVRSSEGACTLASRELTLETEEIDEGASRTIEQRPLWHSACPVVPTFNGTGAVEIQVTADAGDRVFETDEANTVTREVEVEPVPDLEARDIVPVNATRATEGGGWQVYRGDVIGVRVDVANTGHASIRAPVRVSLEAVTADGEIVGTPVQESTTVWLDEATSPVLDIPIPAVAPSAEGFRLRADVNPGCHATLPLREHGCPPENRPVRSGGLLEVDDPLEITKIQVLDTLSSSSDAPWLATPDEPVPVDVTVTNAGNTPARGVDLVLDAEEVWHPAYTDEPAATPGELHATERTSMRIDEVRTERFHLPPADPQVGLEGLRLNASLDPGCSPSDPDPCERMLTTERLLVADASPDLLVEQVQARLVDTQTGHVQPVRDLADRANLSVYEGTRLELDTVVANEGPAPAWTPEGFNVAAEITDRGNATFQVPALRSGESVGPTDQPWIRWTPALGTHQLTVCTDPDHRIDDANRSNDCWPRTETGFQVHVLERTEALDLEIEHTDASTATDQVEIDVCATNTGTGVIQGPTPVSLSVVDVGTVNRSVEGTWQREIPVTIHPGDRACLSRSVTWIAEAGPHQVTADAMGSGANTTLTPAPVELDVALEASLEGCQGATCHETDGPLHLTATVEPAPSQGDVTLPSAIPAHVTVTSGTRTIAEREIDIPPSNIAAGTPIELDPIEIPKLEWPDGGEPATVEADINVDPNGTFTAGSSSSTASTPGSAGDTQAVEVEPGVDLVVDAVTLVKGSGGVEPGEALTAVVDLDNRGHADHATSVPPSLPIRVVVIDHQGDVIERRSIERAPTLPGIQAGTAGHVTANLTAPGPQAASFTVEAQLPADLRFASTPQVVRLPHPVPVGAPAELSLSFNGELTPDPPTAFQPVTSKATVTNHGPSPIQAPVRVTLWSNGDKVDDRTIDRLPSGETAPVMFQWTPEAWGPSTLEVCTRTSRGDLGTDCQRQQTTIEAPLTLGGSTFLVDGEPARVATERNETVSLNASLDRTGPLGKGIPLVHRLIADGETLARAQQTFPAGRPSMNVSLGPTELPSWTDCQTPPEIRWEIRPATTETRLGEATLPMAGHGNLTGEFAGAKSRHANTSTRPIRAPEGATVSTLWRLESDGKTAPTGVSASLELEGTSGSGKTTYTASHPASTEGLGCHRAGEGTGDGATSLTRVAWPVEYPGDLTETLTATLIVEHETPTGLRTIEIPGPELHVVPKPRLQMDLSAEPERPAPGEPVDLEVELRNAGNGTLPSIPEPATIYQGPERLPDKVALRKGPLEPGENRNTSIQLGWPATPGLTAFYLQVPAHPEELGARKAHQASAPVLVLEELSIENGTDRTNRRSLSLDAGLASLDPSTVSLEARIAQGPCQADASIAAGTGTPLDQQPWVQWSGPEGKVRVCAQAHTLHEGEPVVSNPAEGTIFVDDRVRLDDQEIRSPSYEVNRSRIIEGSITADELANGTVRAELSCTTPDQEETSSGTWGQSSSARIDGVAPNASATCTMTAEDEAGNTATFTRTIETQPLAPTPVRNLTATYDAFSHEIVLEWDPPADDGGANVTGYAVLHGSTTVGRTSNLRFTADLDRTLSGLILPSEHTYRVIPLNDARPEAPSTLALASNEAQTATINQHASTVQHAYGQLIPLLLVLLVGAVAVGVYATRRTSPHPSWRHRWRSHQDRSKRADSWWPTWLARLVDRIQGVATSLGAALGALTHTEHLEDQQTSEHRTQGPVAEPQRTWGNARSVKAQGEAPPAAEPEEVIPEYVQDVPETTKERYK